MPQLADVFTYLSCSDSLQGKMEVLISLVTDLCKDRVCAEEVENLAKRFHVDISSKPFSQRKRAVLREILVHINRDDSAAPEYRRLLVETEQWLSCKKKSGYFCSYVGCMFKARKHQGKRNVQIWMFPSIWKFQTFPTVVPNLGIC